MISRYTRKRMGELWSEDSKFAAWVRVEFAVLKAKAQNGEIPEHIPDFVWKAMGKIDSLKISEYEARFHHDMNAFLRHISDLIPEEARPYLHEGLTSYDIEDTALGLRLKTATDQILGELGAVEKILWEMAWRHKDTLQAGRTHGVHAEPITFGFKILNWRAELAWFEELIIQTRNSWEVGKISGAVGTYAHVDPAVEQEVAKILFLSLPGISTQIIPRSRYGLYMCILALLAGALEKFATDIRLMSMTEVGEVKEGKGGEEQGSSAMPQKSAGLFANPTKSESICSLSRYVRGLLIPALENQVTWHERDLANSANERMTFMDASIAIDFMLFRFGRVMEELKIFPKRMRKNLDFSKGMIFSGEVLSALMEKGMGRDEAYSLVRSLVLEAQEKCISFRNLVFANKQMRAMLSEKENRRCFNARRQVRRIDIIFRRFGEKMGGGDENA